MVKESCFKTLRFRFYVLFLIYSDYLLIKQSHHFL